MTHAAGRVFEHRGLEPLSSTGRGESYRPTGLEDSPRGVTEDLVDSWAVMWDVDGTLVDTAELHFQAWCVLAREIGQPFTRADFAGTFGWRNPEIIPRLFGGNHTPAEVARLGDRKEDLYRAE